MMPRIVTYAGHQYRVAHLPYCGPCVARWECSGWVEVEPIPGPVGDVRVEMVREWKKQNGDET